MKATAKAPSNIAFIKYWGRTDEALRLPSNTSISMNLSELTTITTVEFSDAYPSDQVSIDGVSDKQKTDRVIAHLDRIRSLAGVSKKAKVVSVNSFPSGTGLSSSASGFAALTVAAAAALSLNLSEKELSMLARQGSGSAARSIPDGFVVWFAGNSHETSYAKTLYPPDHWKICDIVAVISKTSKDIPTSDGQTRASTSPFYETRISAIEQKISAIQHAIQTKDFHTFGEISEREALELHAIMITSWPSLLYWTGETIDLMKHVQQWRRNGIPVYCTFNTGQDVHILCEEQTVNTVHSLVLELPYVQRVIINYPSIGARVIHDHLF